MLRSCGVPPQKFGGETPPLLQAGGFVGKKSTFIFRPEGGIHISAQGNALGLERRFRTSPERAKQRV
ncbi:MAG: hypothetical protein QF473_37410, partial [Planctomycetota bacterium]|nr:hypothetical protein [Planctomycetota bacterium]